MKIYLVTSPKAASWDEYQGFVCVANTEEEARNMHPSDFANEYMWCDCTGEWQYTSYSGLIMKLSTWPHSPQDVKVQYLGEAAPEYTEKQVILGDFNAE